MNKIFIISILALAFCNAKPLDDSNEAVILRSNNEHSEDNTHYSFSFESSDGIKREETGELVLAGKDDDGNDVYELRVTGYYEYLGQDGEQIRTDYQATRDGFNAQGAHLPKLDEATAKLFAGQQLAKSSISGPAFVPNPRQGSLSTITKPTQNKTKIPIKPIKAFKK